MVFLSNMGKRHIKLSKQDRTSLEGILRGGKISARVFKRATGLLELDRGKMLKVVAQTLGVARVTVAAWRDGYKEEGLKCLEDEPRPGRPTIIDGIQRAKITALACSEAPMGHARWNLRLLADKVIELEYCESISHTQVRNILKKTNLNRTLKKRGVSGK